MAMKKQLLVVLSSLLLAAASGSATAAACRAGSAATQGAQQGYERDVGIAAEEGQRNMHWTDLLQQCVGRIAGISATNAFPSLAELIDQEISKVCHAARDRINSTVGVVTGKIGDLSDGNLSVSPIYGGQAPPSSGDIWKSIWR